MKKNEKIKREEFTKAPRRKGPMKPGEKTESPDKPKDKIKEEPKKKKEE